MKRKPSRRKATKKMTLRNKCDSLCSQIVRLRDGCCKRCGTTEHLQWSHHVSRAYLVTRYDLGNACAHCRGCHMYFTNHPLEHEEWIIGFIGLDAFADLKRRARSLDRYRPDYEAILSDLTSQLRELHEAA